MSSSWAWSSRSFSPEVVLNTCWVQTDKFGRHIILNTVSRQTAGHMDIYPQRLVGPTRGDFTPIFGEASTVDRPLVRMHDQQRQTLLIIFVPKKSKHALNQNQSVFNLLYYMTVTVWGSERYIHPVQIELPSAGPLLCLHQGLSVNLWTHRLRQSQLHYVRKRPLRQMMSV